MQEKDVVTNAFVEDNNRFADIFNGGFYDGCQVLNPSKLREMDRTSGTLFHTSSEGKVNEAVTKYRDVVKESDFGISRIITAIENQTEIHYAMPVKVMALDAYGYDQQVIQKRKMHREKKDIQGVPQVMLESIPDYPLLILDIRRIKNLDKFQTDVGIVFGFLQNATDKESLQKYVADHENEFRHVREDAYNVIAELTNSKELSTIKENVEDGGSDVDMCEAIRDMIEDGKNEGRIEGRIEGRVEGRVEGRTEGEYRKLLELIVKKVQKNKAISQIAEELEESEETIRPLYESVLKETSEYNIDKIYESIKDNLL